MCRHLVNRRNLVCVEGCREAFETENRQFLAARALLRLLIGILLTSLLAGCGATVQHVNEVSPPSSRGTPRTTVGPSTSGSTVPFSAPSTNGAPRPTTPSNASIPAPSSRPSGAVDNAFAQLGTLAVKGRAPKTGYDRDQFGPSWTDDVNVPGGHNGCDTRNDILRRDLTSIVNKPGTHGCVVLTGTLTDPYTGKVIAFRRGVGSSNAVQIDHVVALLDAWQKGAQQLSADQRRDLANDPIELLAVDGPTNASKGAGDAATWLPPNKDYRCRYVALQVAVKARYHLWVTKAEHEAIARILGGCTDTQVRDGR